MANLIRIKQINQAEISGFIADIFNTGQIPVLVSFTGQNIVFTTGSQTISGAKVFATRPQVNGTGIALFQELVDSGNRLALDIRTLSGEAVLDFGNQTISGTKNFTTRPQVNGVGLALTSELVAGQNELFVLRTGNQIISGRKDFNERPTVQNILPLLASGDVPSSGDINSRFSLTGNKLAYDIRTLSGNAVLDFGNQTIFGVKTFAGNQIFSGNINVSGTGIFSALDLNNIDSLSFSGVDVTITSGNVILTNALSAPNIVYNTGNQTISGVKTFANSGIFSLSGASPLGLPNNPLSVVGSGNTYLQINIQNRATGTTATADLVITANNGTDISNYINLGINNSGYNDPTFSNGSGLDGYLFIDGGNLDIGTQTAGTSIEFHAGGTTSNRIIARINSDGLTVVSGNLTAQNTADLFPVSSGIRRYLIPSEILTVSNVTPGRYTGEYNPFFLRKNVTNFNIAVENSVAGDNGLLLQVAIYSGNNGLINAPIAWSGSINVPATLGIYRVNASANLNKGPYILGIMNTGTTSTTTTLRAAGITSSNKIFGESTGLNTFGGGGTASIRYLETGISLPNRIGINEVNSITPPVASVMVGLEY